MMALLGLCACSNAPRGLKVQTAPVEIKKPDETPNIPNPAPLSLQPLEWQLITTPAGALFALTAAGYEALARNNAEVFRWVSEAQWRLKYYRGELPEQQDAAEPPEPAETE